jgi:hypothetical protein
MVISTIPRIALHIFAACWVFPEAIHFHIIAYIYAGGAHYLRHKATPRFMCSFFQGAELVFIVGPAAWRSNEAYSLNAMVNGFRPYFRLYSTILWIEVAINAFSKELIFT